MAFRPRCRPDNISISPHQQGALEPRLPSFLGQSCCGLKPADLELAVLSRWLGLLGKIRLQILWTAGVWKGCPLTALPAVNLQVHS